MRQNEQIIIFLLVTLQSIYEDLKEVKERHESFFWFFFLVMLIFLPDKY